MLTCSWLSRTLRRYLHAGNLQAHQKRHRPIVAALEAKLGQYLGEDDLVNAQEWL